jgi:hypothetical protein
MHAIDAAANIDKYRDEKEMASQALMIRPIARTGATTDTHNQNDTWRAGSGYIPAAVNILMNTGTLCVLSYYRNGCAHLEWACP